MERTLLRTGIAGSGYAAKFHYDALLRVFSVKLDISGAYSPTMGKLEQFTGPRNMKAYKSLEDLINDVDVVHVCTPPSTHEQL